MFDPSFDMMADYDPSPLEAMLWDCKILGKSAKAVKVLYDGEEYWLPFSQMIGSYTDVAVGDVVDIEITDWLARQKGLSLYQQDP